MTSVSPLTSAVVDRRRAAVLGAAVALGLGVLLTGCSADDAAPVAAPTSTSPSPLLTGVPPQKWAAAVCDSLAGWREQAASVAATKVSGDDAAALDAQLRTAVTALAGSTHESATAVADAGRPASAVGEAAQLQMGPLAAQLDTAAGVLDTLVSGPVADAADADTRWSQVRSVITTAERDALTAMSAVSQLEPAGNLGRALAATPSCKALTRKE